MGHSHDFEAVVGRLKMAGYKLTSARRRILNILAKEHGPFSAEEIFLKLADQSCDLATIYRNINTFLEIKLISQCDFGDGIARYEYLEEGSHHHHHVICRQCRQSETLDYCFVKEVERMIEDKGYQNVSHRLEFYGLCQNCQAT